MEPASSSSSSSSSSSYNKEDKYSLSKQFSRSLTLNHSSAAKSDGPLQRQGSFKGTVEKLRTLFEKSSLKKSKIDENPKKNNHKLVLPGTEDRVVVYFTSLRGVRRTFEDCYAVKMILGGFRVLVDERDVSMDTAYKKELENIVLGKKKKNSGLRLPQVFIRGCHIGGVEDVKHLNEIGELGKMLKGLPFRPIGSVGCRLCGNVRFVPCFHCNGSKKVYDDDYDVKRCLYCNENGLLRCPTCCV